MTLRQDNPLSGALDMILESAMVGVDYRNYDFKKAEAKSKLTKLLLEQRIDELNSLRGVAYGISNDGTIADMLQHIDAVMAVIESQLNQLDKEKHDL